MENPTHFQWSVNTRAFWAGLAALLGLVGVYTALVLAQWAHTQLGQHPEGESAAWLTDAESLYRGTAPREPFFRAPAYLAVLVLMRDASVPASGLADAARALNGCAHLLATALLVGIGLRFWRIRGALFAGALWGFYPPAVFMAAQPGPASLALLVWLGGVVAALDIVWQSPIWRGSRLGARHAWACPFIAGVAFALAAALSTSYWPTALAWPVVAIFLGRDARGSRMLAAALGVGLMIGGLVMLQFVWSGSPQPLAGADLYRLDQALEITQPWAVPLPAFEFSDDQAASDALEKEAVVTYKIQTGKPPSGLAVLDGYWWRGAATAVVNFPTHSLLRAARKAFQFFAAEEFSAGPDYARARADAWPLCFNPLGWTVLFALGLGGWVLGRRVPAMGLVLVLVVLAGVGGIVWYPTLEARAPLAALLALLASAMLVRPWPIRRATKIGLCAGMAAAAVFTWLPRPHDASSLLAARDSRERAVAAAGLGDFDNAIRELARAEGAAPLSPLGQDLAADWRFAQILKKFPVLPTAAELERQMLDNADIAANSPAAQFRCGAYLWLLGRTDGAVYYWENLSNNNDPWGAAARTAMAESGYETPAQARRRSAWEMGGGPQPDSALAPLFTQMRFARASAMPAQN